MDRFLGVVKPKVNAVRSTIRAKRSPQEMNKHVTAAKDTESFNEVTELCDSLVAKGFHTVLEESREKLTAMLYSRKFEYRWKGQTEAQVFGPFSYEQLMTWGKQGCFTANPIEVRYFQSSQPWGEFHV